VNANDKPAPNLCPACGPVDASASSRYCVEHLREMVRRAKALLGASYAA
jgi:hypothetical protein